MSRVPIICAFALLTLPPASQAAELGKDALCKLLTAEEVTAVMGNARKIGTSTLTECLYESASVPALHLMNSSLDTQKEFVEDAKAMQGKCQDAPDGAAMCALGFDAKKGRISAVWFKSGDAALEIQSDAGLEPDKALALLEAARH